MNIKLVSVLTLVLTGLPLSVSAQDAQLEEVNALGREISARVRAAGANGNLLTELEALRGLEKEYADKGPMAQQVLALHLMQRTVELGNYAEALRQADLSPQSAPPVDAAGRRALEKYEAVDALEVIADMAEEELLVLINEAHHVPQHRAFSIELLRMLRPLGFTHFAAETLYEADVDLNERGYPTKMSGAYINEPVYGDLVRTALALGYVVVPYESRGGNRELGQATNLIERILEVDPEARVVVHAGYAHINEQGSIAGARAMAGQLKEITGIDPLTIDQTVMTEHSAAQFEHPLYRHVVDGRALSAPSILVDATGTPWTLEPGTRDVTLFHPLSVYQQGRPTWLLLGGLRRPYELPADVCGSEPRVLVTVRVASESDEAIPIDRIEVVAGEPVPALLLPIGEFVLEVKSLGDETLRKEKIEVR
jgi:hypothetical protein